jgi:hypothetical protein
MAPDEVQFGKWLLARGYQCSHQLAVGRYNLDLAHGSVAIEIHGTPQDPLVHPLARRRIEYLLKRHWHVCYIWVSHTHTLTEVAAEHVVPLLKFAESHKTARRQYWVIRGSGEVVTSARFDGDKLPTVG